MLPLAETEELKVENAHFVTFGTKNLNINNNGKRIINYKKLSGYLK